MPTPSDSEVNEALIKDYVTLKEIAKECYRNIEDMSYSFETSCTYVIIEINKKYKLALF